MEEIIKNIVYVGVSGKEKRYAINDDYWSEQLSNIEKPDTHLFVNPNTIKFGPSQEERRNKIRWAVAIQLFNEILTSYEEDGGDFEAAICQMKKILEKPSNMIGYKSKDEVMAWFIEQLLTSQPKKRKSRLPGAPFGIKFFSALLVEDALRENFKKIRSDGKEKSNSAFMKAAERLSDSGYPVSERQIENWYYEILKMPSIPNSLH